MKSVRLTAAAVAAALAVTALAGCSDDGSSDPTPTQSRVETSPLPAPSSFKEDTRAGAAADVTEVECPTKAGAVTYQGKVKNSAKQARDYQIMVIWMKKGDSQPYASGEHVEQGLGAGEEVSFEVSTDLPIDVDTCVLNVYAGELTDGSGAEDETDSPDPTPTK